MSNTKGLIFLFVGLQVALIVAGVFIFFSKNSEVYLSDDNIMYSVSMADGELTQNHNIDPSLQLRAKNQNYQSLLAEVNATVINMYNVYIYQYGKDLILKTTEMENQGDTIKLLIEGSGIGVDGDALTIRDEVWIDLSSLAENREATMVIHSDFDWFSRLGVKMEVLK